MSGVRTMADCGWRTWPAARASVVKYGQRQADERPRPVPPFRTNTQVLPDYHVENFKILTAVACPE